MTLNGLVLGGLAIAAPLGGPKAGDFGEGGAIDEPENPLVLDVQDKLETRQAGDDVQVMLVQVLEGRILAEDIHALPLREDDADRAVLEDQPRLPIQKDTHLLVQPQLNKMLRQPLI